MQIFAKMRKSVDIFVQLCYYIHCLLEQGVFLVRRVDPIDPLGVNGGGVVDMTYGEDALFVADEWGSPQR